MDSTVKERIVWSFEFDQDKFDAFNDIFAALAKPLCE